MINNDMSSTVCYTSPQYKIQGMHSQRQKQCVLSHIYTTVLINA